MKVQHPSAESLIGFGYQMRLGYDRMMTRERLLLIQFALRKHRLKYGVFPDHLAQIVPEFMPSLPVDLFSETPNWVYVHSDDEAYVYSKGPNGEDEWNGMTLQDISDNINIYDRYAKKPMTRE